jgi:hypothetical protein
MAAARHDMDIVWILMIAVALVVGIWKHGEILSWVSSTWTRLF